VSVFRLVGRQIYWLSETYTCATLTRSQGWDESALTARNVTEFKSAIYTSECTRRNEAARFSLFGNVARQKIGTERESDAE
jgi:hypothetical protein